MNETIHLTPEELAARWHTKPGTLAKWRQRGNGPIYVKFGRHVLYPIGAIDAYEQEHLRKAVSVQVKK